MLFVHPVINPYSMTVTINDIGKECSSAMVSCTSQRLTKYFLFAEQIFQKLLLGKSQILDSNVKLV